MLRAATASAPLRIAATPWVGLALALGALVACSSSPPPATATPDLTITTPVFTLRPGEERTSCYYTTLANAAAIGVKRFESTVSAGSHHVILWTTDVPLQPDGTLEPDCATGNNPPPGHTPVWTYVAQSPEAATSMPTGVGMRLDPNQPVFLEMHYLNPREEPLTVQAKLRIFTHRDRPYVVARPFIAFDSQFVVPAHTRATVRRTCALPSAGAKFFLLTTHQHRFTTRARILDGAEPVVTTSDWSHPAVREFAEPYYAFRSGSLTFECDIDNTTSLPLVYGPSARTDEMCVGIGYFFPADGPVLSCENGVTRDPTHGPGPGGDGDGGS